MALFGPDNEILTATATAIPPKKRDLEPAPGQVIVLRPEIETQINGVEKPIQVLEREERDNVIAAVARIGETDRELWFDVGDEVVIAPHVFTEISLGFGETVWLGPIIGVKARFVEAES